MVLYAFIAFFGYFFGYLIANYTKDELKSGFLYFNILEILILFLLFVFSVYFNFIWWLFVLGFLLIFILRLDEHFYFGILLFSEVSFLFSGLIFVYNLAYGTLVYYNKKNWKELVYSLIVFLAAFLVSFLDFSFVSFASGSFLGLAVFKVIKLAKSRH